MAEILTVADLERAKQDDTFHAEVITGKLGGNGADIDFATHARTGQIQTTLPKVLSNVGFSPAGFDFTTGGTLTERDKAIFYQADGNWYSWGGTLPKVVPPASSPASTGGIADNAWNVSTSAFMYRDWEGFTAELLAQAGIVPNGQPDKLGASQRVQAINRLAIDAGLFSTISEMITYSDHRLGNTYSVVSNGFYDTYTVVSYTTSINLGSGLYAQLSKNSNTLLDYAIPKANVIASLRGDGAKANLVVISDSFGDGVGATVFQNRFGESLDAMVSNSAAKGYGTGTHARLTDVVNISGSGITSNGTITTNGALESQLRLAAGQYIEVTGYEIDFADVWNFGATTTGDLVCTLNGVQYQTLVTTKVAGIKTSFPNGATPRRTLKTDIIRLTAVGGQVDVTGFNPARSSAGGIYTIRISHGGWSYKTYDNQLIVDEIAEYAKFNAASSVFILQLGTNSIYNASEAQTPSEMITSMFSFMTKLSLITQTIGFIVCIPPRSNESSWPVIKNGYTYDDYRNALLNWGEQQGVQTIDLSDIQLVKFGMTSDGLHPSDASHLLIAEKIANEIGCYAAPIKDDAYSKPLEYKLPVYNDLWGDFGGNSGVKEVKEGNRKSLSGFAAKNASTSATILTIQSAKDFPKNRDPQFICVTNNGTTVIAIDHTTGAVVVVGTTAFEWVCLDSVSYEIANA